jgi:hypothetical protein
MPGSLIMDDNVPPDYIHSRIDMLTEDSFGPTIVDTSKH